MKHNLEYKVTIIYGQSNSLIDTSPIIMGLEVMSWI